jgi:hypothetical protein
LPLANTEIDADVHDGQKGDGLDASDRADASDIGDKDAALGSFHRGLNPEQIRSVVIAHRGALQACYEHYARQDPTLRGSVTVDWTIDASGTVASARLVDLTIGDARVGGCVVHQVRAWHFPSSDGTSQVRFPFSFGIGQPPGPSDR